MSGICLIVAGREFSAAHHEFFREFFSDGDPTATMVVA